MCKCIDNIIKSQLNNGKSKSNGKKVVVFEFTRDAAGEFFNFKTGKYKGYKTKSNCRYRLDGEKKIHSSFMQHNFCPFCGKAYK